MYSGFRIAFDRVGGKYFGLWRFVQKFVWSKTSTYHENIIETKIKTYGDKVCTNFHGLIFMSQKMV